MRLSFQDWVMQVTAILVLHKLKIEARFTIAALFCCLFFSSCSEFNQKKSDQINKALSDSLLSTTETWNLDMNLIEEGRIKVHLHGTYAATFEDEDSDSSETRISGPIAIKVFDSTATIKTWVNSDSAIYRAESSEFELFGDVHVRTRDKRYLESEYLKWNQTVNKISTPQFVIITTPTDSIAGTGFNGTTDLNSYTIKEPTGQVEFN